MVKGVDGYRVRTRRWEGRRAYAAGSMVSGGVCVGFVAVEGLKPEQSILTIRMDVEYGYAEGGGHDGEGCMGQRLALI